MKTGNRKKKISPHFIIEIVLIIAVIMGMGAYWLNRHSIANNAAPEITIEAQSNEFSVKATEEDLLSGVVAMDKEDGNVSSSIIIESISQIFDGNKRTVTYVAFDSSNNVKKLDRDIVYTDYSSPKFTSSRNISVPTGRSTEILAKVKAEDCVDGDISDKIRLEINETNVGIPGRYAAKLSVTNSCGDVSTQDIVVTVTGEEAD